MSFKAVKMILFAAKRKNENGGREEGRTKEVKVIVKKNYYFGWGYQSPF